jgi:hypothetical protein
MSTEPTSAPAEGEALPVSGKPSLVSRVEADAKKVETAVERAVAAVERWYAAHFHAHAVAGTPPITADDKAALIQHVADAVAPTATQE